MSEKLKILMITTFYPPYNFGGDGIFIYRLSNELARRGHVVHIIHCINAYELFEPNGPKGDYPNHPNITVHRLRNRLGFLNLLMIQQTGYPFFKGRVIKALIAEKNFDIIHYHNMTLIGLHTLTYGNAIKLYTMHEHWLVCPMHVLWKFNKEACTRKNCVLCMLAAKRPVQWWRYTGFMERTLSHVDAFISPSRFTKKKHHEMGFSFPITHIPYFLPKSRNHGQSEQLPENIQRRSYFLFVGRLEKIKGVQNLIRVFRQYTACDLIIAGDGEYAGILHNLACDVPNIRFLGRLSYDKLRALYINALAVIVPSICYEVFGIIIIESFAMGTPVIANNFGALPEVVEESGGGFIYNNDDELIEFMEKIRLDPNLRDELGEKGYQACIKYWTEDYCIKRYYQLIEEVAARKNITNPAIEALKLKK